MSTMAMEITSGWPGSFVEPGQNLYEQLIGLVSEGVYIVDRDRRIAFWNSAAERITGYPSDVVVGRCCADGILQHCNDRGEMLCGTKCPLVDTMRDGRGRDVDAFFQHSAGRRVPVNIRSSVVRDADGEVVGCAEIFTDTSPVNAMLEELREAREHARLDALTRIGNRRMIEEALAAFGGQRRPASAAIIFFDIDHFKAVNDTYGHEVGDRTIVEVARTAAAVVRSFDTIGRWGGEEFVAIARGVDASGAAALADRLRAMIAVARIPVLQGTLGVTISAGVTTVHPDEPGEEALARADKLMYESKQRGRNRVTAG